MPIMDLVRDLRRLLAERVNERVAVLRAAIPSRPLVEPVAPPPRERGPAPAIAGSGASSPSATGRPASPLAGPPTGLVNGLFATPQSVAAAFIAAEILGKPIALRDR